MTVPARRITGRAPGPRLLDRLELATGNPLYVREIMDALTRAGALGNNEEETELGPATPARSGTDGGWAEVEQMSLSEAIADRLAFLTADTRDMLRTAALLGPAFGITDLTLLLGLPAMALAAPVHEAVAAGVLEPADGNRLRFRHGLIKQVLYQSVPAALRIAIHRDAAQTLIAQRTSVERVAELLLSAADAADGWEVDWLVDNAATLIRRAPEAATSLLKRAVAHTSDDDVRVVELLDHLASAAFLVSDYEQAVPVAQRVLARHRAPERRGRTAWILAYALLRTDRAEESITTVEKVMADLEPDTPWHARLRVFAAMALLHLGRDDEAAAQAAAVLTTGTSLTDAMSSGYARHTLAMTHWARQDPESALDHGTRGIALTGSDPELSDLLLLMQGNQVSVLLIMDRLTQCQEVLADTHGLAERTGSFRLGMFVAMAGELAFHTGRWDDALTAFDTLSDYHPTWAHSLPAVVHGIAAVIAAHRDEQTTARRHLRVLEELPDGPYKTRNLAYDFRARHDRRAVERPRLCPRRTPGRSRPFLRCDGRTGRGASSARTTRSRGR
ncbi:tetratricopeptide repeat protein [Streptomyces sp. NBC_01591]|uniref:tetratricopeptide repeat protein n=1 Tax=Streptomyces sp. NBC_01591 TaxID=2975888 RepID=UPI002DD82A97|nr:tetratricopeptide repeat protein [Streptomyces sp. NBC_01591]WSD66820.1 tetratricopeptide repeat protein [Streptomyces sp. NBC_01591]